ncbi:hypothetical protein [Mycobacterium sp. IS-3022]|nr:hypothetical protein [Mycobacterium sp. IS-3022]
MEKNRPPNWLRVTERTLVTIHEAIKERFEFLGDQLADEGLNIGLPTGN